MNKIQANLKIALTNGLAAVDCPLNAKLRSEDRLVTILGCSRRFLRNVLDELASEGIVRRQRPVGTFLIRRPAAIPLDQIPADMPLNLQQILPELLVEEDKQCQAPTVGPSINQPLPNVQFWGITPTQGPAQHLFQLGMLQAAMQMNVKLTFHALETEAGLLTYEQVWEQMRREPCDIYVLPVEWRENFAACFEDRTTLYIDWGSMMEPEKTNIGLDSYEQMERALEMFAQAGLTRIAMVAKFMEGAESDWYQQNMRRRYSHFMTSHHLNDGCISFIKIRLSEVVAATRALLRDYRPEAIYVHDDFLLRGCAMELHRQKRIPGRNIALITASNRGIPLPPDYHWTALQCDMKEMGVQTLIQAVHCVDHLFLEPPSIWLNARWQWGDTHLSTVKNQHEKTETEILC